MQLLYDLMYYGIPVEALPVNASGVYTNDQHLVWLYKRQKIEENSNMNSTRVARSPGAGVQAIDGRLAGNAPLNSLASPPQFLSKVTPASPTAWLTGIAAASTNLGRLNLASPVTTTPTAKPQPTAIFAQPLPNDVIVRDRGKTVDQMEGNKRFLQLIVKYTPTFIKEYNEAMRVDKSGIIDKLRVVLEEKHSIRFIKRVDHHHNTNKKSKPLYMPVDYNNTEDFQYVKNKISRTMRRTHQYSKQK